MWIKLTSSTGKKTCIENNLICGKKGHPCDEYNDKIDPSSTAEYAHNAFRYFHKDIPSKFAFVNESYAVVEKIPVSDLLLKSSILNDKYDNLLRGLLIRSILVNRPGYSPEVFSNQIAIQF